LLKEILAVDAVNETTVIGDETVRIPES